MVKYRAVNDKRTGQELTADQAERLYTTAVQLFISASLELASGARLSQTDLEETLRTAGLLLYHLSLAQPQGLADEDIPLEAAGALSLAGFSANAAVALRVRDARRGIPQLRTDPSTAFALYLLLNRRMTELRTATRRWVQTRMQAAPQTHRDASLLQACEAVAAFTLNGDPRLLAEATRAAGDWARILLQSGSSEDWFLARCFHLSLDRLQLSSTWTLLEQALGDLSPLWRNYVRGLALGLRDPEPSPVLGQPVRRGCIIDLWPSQAEALRKGLLNRDVCDYVIRMPTSAGKTRLAEFKIVSALSNRTGLCIYVVPFVALADEVRESLRASLGRIGIGVGDLFQGEYALTDLDQALLMRHDVIVCTPEKLDLVLRQNPDLCSQVRLFVFDEGHIIDDSTRGIRYEFLIDRLCRWRRRRGGDFSVLVMSAVVPNAEDLAVWIAGTEGGLLDSDWKPTEVRYGVFHWDESGYRGDIDYIAQGALHGYRLEGIINRRGIPGSLCYPDTKAEICAELARVLVPSGSVAIFSATRRNVNVIVRALHRMIGEHGLELPTLPDNMAKVEQAIERIRPYVGERHTLIQALRQGFAYHTGLLPQSVRTEIERLYRTGATKLLVCTNTLAQGVNLPIRTLILHSLNRGQPIPYRDFVNIAGRTARAMRQVEGQVLFVHNDGRSQLAQSEERYLQPQAPDDHVMSSILLLYARLAARRGELAADATSRALLTRIAAAHTHGPDEEADLESELATLDAQLLGLLVEEAYDDDTIEVERLLDRSLFDVQARKYHVQARPILNDLSRRVQSITRETRDPLIRTQYFQTGFGPASCRKLVEASQGFLDMLAQAPDDVGQADEVLAAALDTAIQTEETRPVRTVRRFDLARPFMAWIRGARLDEMPCPAGMTIDSLACAVEDVFVRKLPWAMNAIYILLAEPIRQRRDPLPDYLTYLAVLSRYGVPTAQAATCRAAGVTDRSAAMRLGRASPPGGAPAILDWLARLGPSDVARIVGDDRLSAQVYKELRAAQLDSPGARGLVDAFRRAEVRGVQFHAAWRVLERLHSGDRVDLVREPENPEDPNAILAVTAAARQRLGYLGRGLARIIAPLLDEGIAFDARIVEIQHPSPTFPSGRLYLELSEGNVPNSP